MAASYATKIVYILTSGQLLYNNIPDLYNANKVPLGFLRHFQGMDCVDFIENASFKSSDDIC